MTPTGTTPTPTPSLAPAAPATPDRADERFSFVVHLHDGYMQVVDWALDGVTPLETDEPPPLGADRGPNPARVLGAAVASCLGASLLFCLRKSRIEVRDLRTIVEGRLMRNARGRLRIGELKVHLAPTVAAADRERMTRCLEIFEDFCVVTQSVREGIAIDVQVEPVS